MSDMNGNGTKVIIEDDVSVFMFPFSDKIIFTQYVNCKITDFSPFQHLSFISVSLLGRRWWGLSGYDTERNWRTEKERERITTKKGLNLNMKYFN